MTIFRRSILSDKCKTTFFYNLFHPEYIFHFNVFLAIFNIFFYRYEGKDGYDPAKHSISVYSSAKKELTSEDFFKGAVKKMVGSIRDTDDVSFDFRFVYNLDTIFKKMVCS